MCWLTQIRAFYFSIFFFFYLAHMVLPVMFFCNVMKSCIALVLGVICIKHKDKITGMSIII